MTDLDRFSANKPCCSFVFQVRNEDLAGEIQAWTHHVQAQGLHILGYLAHKKTPPPRTLQQAYAYGPMMVVGGGAASDGRGTSVLRTSPVLNGKEVSSVKLKYALGLGCRG